MPATGLPAAGLLVAGCLTGGLIACCGCWGCSGWGGVLGFYFIMLLGLFEVIFAGPLSIGFSVYLLTFGVYATTGLEIFSFVFSCTN